MKSETYSPPVANEIFHWLADGLTFSRDLDKPLTGAVSIRGRTEILTPELIRATSDKTGHSFFELLDEPEAQLARWGRRYFARGPAPEAMALHPWPRGSSEESNERSRRIEEAFRLPSHAAVDAELAKINAEFPRTSKPMSSVQYKYRTSEVA
jgi:hypothetical protein